MSICCRLSSTHGATRGRPCSEVAHPMQLDLFLDSRSVMLANDAIAALVARDAERARSALSQLRAEAPDYPNIDALERLSVALATWSAPRADVVTVAGENAADRHDYLVEVRHAGIAPELASAAVGQGFALSELVAERPDLERVFLELTRRATESIAA